MKTTRKYEFISSVYNDIVQIHFAISNSTQYKNQKHHQKHVHHMTSRMSKVQIGNAKIDLGKFKSGSGSWKNVDDLSVCRRMSQLHVL